MRVLICDDDAATRFVIKRVLTQHFGCATVECRDGVEALSLVGREHFDLIVLDVEMPVIDGVETLEAIRQSEGIAHLPVVMMSKERREDVIRRLVKLGISDYVLKPLRPDKVIPKIERLLRAMPLASLPVNTDVRSVRLGNQQSVLIVDGSLDFRHFFVDVVGKYGPVMQADSGASALALYRRAPCRIAFIGSDIGVVGAPFLIRKIRAMSAGHPVRIVGLLNQAADAEAAASAGFDDILPRTFGLSAFAAALAPLLPLSAPLAQVFELVPDLQSAVASAVTQVFGMMADSDVVGDQRQMPAGVLMASTVRLTLQGGLSISLAFALSKPMAVALSAKLGDGAPASISDDDCLSTAGELANLVTGRLHALFEERNLHHDCSLPKTQVYAPGAWVEPVETEGLTLRFTVPGVEGVFGVAIHVTEGGAPAGRQAEAIAVTPDAPMAPEDLPVIDVTPVTTDRPAVIDVTPVSVVPSDAPSPTDDSDPKQFGSTAA